MPMFEVAKGEVVAIVGRVGSGKCFTLAANYLLPPKCACMSCFTVPPFTSGLIYMVHGVPLYAGKSSVLQALLSRMIAQKGSVKVGGIIAYVPQVNGACAWLSLNSAEGSTSAPALTVCNCLLCIRNFPNYCLQSLLEKLSVGTLSAAVSKSVWLVVTVCAAGLSGIARDC